ncbi:enoyl-CoA hydratase [Roseovarius sp. A-2]|nr:enoyl-CoA hydratase [Roseovarius sp. A-2]
MQAIVNCPKPVIAEVTGVAAAAGCQQIATEWLWSYNNEHPNVGNGGMTPHSN